MSPQLRDLLPAVKEMAPPAPFTADDILAGGRRRKRNRQVVRLVSCAAAVAAAGVLVAPRLLPAAAPDTSGTGPAVQAAARPERKELSLPGNFQGNIAEKSVGKLSITETVYVTRGFQSALVKGKDGRDDGSITVYGAGVLDAKEYFMTGEPVNVNGHAGRYLPKSGLLTLESAQPALIWPYADGAYAVVAAKPASAPESASKEDVVTGKDFSPAISKEQMIDVAEAAGATAAKPVTIGFKFDNVPAGYHLDAAGPSDEDLWSDTGRSEVRFFKGEVSYKGIPGPFRELLDNNADPDRTKSKALAEFRILVAPTDGAKRIFGRPGEIRCQDTFCNRVSDDGKFMAELSDGTLHLTTDEMRGMLTGVTFATSSDQAKWFKAIDSAE